MADLTIIQERHIALMSKTSDIIGHILKNVSVEQATSLRDSPEGWTILEIVCHLRDFDTIFRERAQKMLTENHPELPAYNEVAMAIEKAYIEEDFAYAYDGFLFSRTQTIEFFQNLNPEHWEKAGVHPERGHFTMTDAVIQVGHHDITHIEQITLLLEQETPGSGALPSESMDISEE